MRLFSAIVAVFAVMFMYTSVTPVHAADESIVKMHEQMLYTVVQVQSGRGTGSGTVIYSEQDENGDWETFILTNHHVINDSIRFVKEWDPNRGEDVNREHRDLVTVSWYNYNDLNRFVGTLGKAAEIVAYHRRADLALLRVVDKETGSDYVARLLDEDVTLYMGEGVYAVGAGLGNPPFMTSGILGFMHHRIDGFNYHLATAPVIFGNSGGALFRMNEDGDYELIGVPAMISAARVSMFSVQAISHMAWSIQMETVRKFIRDNNYGYILGDPRDSTSTE